MYVAEFEYDGIEYQIVAEQMEAEEVVKVVSSIIYGEEVFVDAQYLLSKKTAICQ